MSTGTGDEDHVQVRYAACVCARSFLLAAEGYKQEYYPLILPHLCFNRYDVAEGVRYYSLDTWKLVLKMSGPAEVAKHIHEVTNCCKVRLTAPFQYIF